MEKERHWQNFLKTKPDFIYFSKQMWKWTRESGFFFLKCQETLVEVMSIKQANKQNDLSSPLFSELTLELVTAIMW